MMADPVHMIDLRRPPKSRGRESLVEGSINSGDVGYTDEESELLIAVARYRQVNGAGYVGPTDVLWILKAMGWKGPGGDDKVIG